MARELKYSTPSTDLDALKRELSGKPSEDSDNGRESSESDDYDYEDDYRR